jgi:signal transduction histidine kinase
MKKSKILNGNRSSSLLDLSVNYDEKDTVLERFSELICLTSGALYSQINLIDDQNQWTVAECGMQFPHIPVEESICYITLNKEDVYEIKDFNDNEKFNDHPLVRNSPYLKYYLGFPFQDEKGVFIGTSCILHTENPNLSDSQIKSLKLINDQIKDYLIMKRKLKNEVEKVNRLEKIVTKTRHDIRSPLSGIIGFSGLLENEIKDKTHLKNIGLIKKSATNLLEYAEETLQTELNNHTETSISAIIEKLRSLYSMQSELKDLEIIFENECPENTSINEFSSNQIVNIIGNVVSNAIKFSPVNSSVKVLFNKKELEDDKFICVSVIDSGVGIPADKLDSLNKLEPVESGKSTSQVSGFGIGLIEALKLLHQKNGNFSITSEVNNGTKVVLNFPTEQH